MLCCHLFLPYMTIQPCILSSIRLFLKKVPGRGYSKVNVYQGFGPWTCMHVRVEKIATYTYMHAIYSKVDRTSSVP